MKTWLIVALGLLLVPLAAGQSDAFTHFQTTKHVTPTSDQFQATPAELGCPETGGIWSSPDAYTLRFRDPSEASACGERRIELDELSGRTFFQVALKADRLILNDAGVGIPFSVVQELRVYDADNADENAPLFTHALYSPTEGSQPNLKQITVDVNLPNPVARVQLGLFVHEIPGPELLQGQELADSLVAPSQTVVTTFTDVHVRYPESLSPTTITNEHDGVEGKYELLSSTIAIRVSDPQISANFTLGPDWTLKEVRWEGERVPPSTLDPSRENNLQAYTLPLSAVQDRGEGTWQIELAGKTPLETNWFMIAAVSMVGFTPLVMGGVAVRGALSMWREAGGAGRGSLKTMQAMLLVIGGIYLGTILWVWLGPGFHMVVAWPLLMEAAVVHAVMVMTSVVFLILGLRWRRVLHAAIRKDLAEKQSIMEELKRSNQELEQFAYVASHDLQEPLRMVSSYTDLLERRFAGKFGEDGDQYIQFAREGSQRMSQLINDLLQFSRIATHGSKFTDVDLGDVMKDVRQNLEVALEDVSGTLEIGRMPVLVGDRTQLLRLFQNLIHNGIKFKAPDRNAHVKVTASKEGQYWVIHVADNGIGIDRKHHERIFVIFQRLHSRAQYQGTGLGLALVKRIAERHGGTIWVSSEVGKGSTFHVKIPEEPKLGGDA